MEQKNNNTKRNIAESYYPKPDIPPKIETQNTGILGNLGGGLQGNSLLQTLLPLLMGGKKLDTQSLLSGLNVNPQTSQVLEMLLQKNTKSLEPNIVENKKKSALQSEFISVEEYHKAHSDE